MHDAFATHEVFNQSPPFEDVNLFTGDRPLIEAVQREGGGRAVKRLTAFGAVCGSAEAFEQGRLANEFPPRLKPFDSKGRRLDTVEYHPAYHACMEIGIKEGLHCSAWDHLAKPRAKPVTGANVVRSAGTYMAIQMEAGHQCPITMTCQFRDRPSTRRRSASASPSAIGNGAIPTPDFAADTRPSTLLLRATKVASGAICFSQTAMRCFARVSLKLINGRVVSSSTDCGAPCLSMWARLA